MKIISWNVNGIRATIKKGFKKSIKELNPDILLLQEIKADSSIVSSGDFKIDGYTSIWHSAKKKGYAGTAFFTKFTPLSITKFIGNKNFDSEGRMIMLEFDNFFIIDTYLPHTGRKLENISKKLFFNKLLFDFCEKYRSKKPIIVGGDFNVAHKEIDLARPKDNKFNAGFTLEERSSFDIFLKSGYIDSFRQFNKSPGKYTWWSYRFKARLRNIGWRVDYLLVDKTIKIKLKSASIYSSIDGSDHCPIGIEIDV